MSDPNKKPETADDTTVRPDGSPEHTGATEEQYLPVGGPRSGTENEGGTEDAGIIPEDEITPG